MLLAHQRPFLSQLVVAHFLDAGTNLLGEIGKGSLEEKADAAGRCYAAAGVRDATTLESHYCLPVWRPNTPPLVRAPRGGNPAPAQHYSSPVVSVFMCLSLTPPNSTVMSSQRHRRVALCGTPPSVYCMLMSMCGQIYAVFFALSMAGIW